MFPDYNWLPWKFERCPQGYWDNVNNHKLFLEWAGKQLRIKEMSDWYKIAQKVEKFPEISEQLGFCKYWRRFIVKV